MSSKIKILYIEDEPFLGKIVKETLESKEYQVLWETDGAKVMQQFKTFQPTVCVVDVMLPNVDGYTLGQQLRVQDPLMPIIFLTAKSQTEDVIQGFASGGTDYLKKPFSIEELVARINNQVNLLSAVRTIKSNDVNEEIQFGKCKFFPGKLELHTPRQIIKLSHKEFQVLHLLAQYTNQIIDRKMILLSVWGDDSYFNSRTLDVYIRKLREYFGTDSDIEIITLKGKGYQVVVS